MRGDLETPLILEAYKTHVIKWWVEASFSVYPDTTIHMGATIYIGKGSICSTQVFYKINARRSVE